MLAKVRTGYGFSKANRSYKPGEVVELTDKEYNERHQIFELAEATVTKEESSAKEEPVLENRAILDSTAGAPIVRRGSRKK